MGIFYPMHYKELWLKALHPTPTPHPKNNYIKNTQREIMKKHMLYVGWASIK
jgi:hypothetical protein